MNDSQIVIIGAGFSGIVQAMTLIRSKITDFIIIEKADRIGGTWRDNKYPGCDCDIQVNLYQVSFEMNPDWDSLWVSSDCIEEYMNKLVKKYKLQDKIRFNQTVKDMIYDDKNSKWNIKILNSDIIYTSKYLISCVGQLNQPSIPNFKNMKQYQGRIIHSAQWERKIDLNNKTVAVIGCGPTSAQLVPSIVDKVQSLSVYMRTPHYFAPSFAKINRKFFAIENFAMKYIPFFQRYYRFLDYCLIELLQLLCYQIANNFWRKICLWDMRRIIKKQDLIQKLTPDYEVGCNRIVLNDGSFYRSLMKPNCIPIFEGIQEFTKNGIITPSCLQKDFDVVILCTGFKTIDFLYEMNVKGRDNKVLFDQKDYRTYYGMCVPGFPNFFIQYGPNTNYGAGSILFLIESSANFITRAIKECEDQNSDFIDIKEEEMLKFDDYLQGKLQKSYYNGQCTSWYKDSKGRILTNWYGSQTTYWLQTARINISKKFNFSCQTKGYITKFINKIFRCQRKKNKVQ